MLRMRVLLGILLVGFASGQLAAQEVRQDAAGEDIIVYPDGTWRYANAKPTTTDLGTAVGPNQRVLQLAETALVEAQRLEDEYRAAVRARALAEADFTTAKVDPTGSKRAQEAAKEDFQRAKEIEAVALDRYETARDAADLYSNAVSYPEKKLRKFLAKQGYPTDPAVAVAAQPNTTDPNEDAVKSARKAEKAAAKARKKEERLAAKAQKQEAKLVERARREGEEAVVVADEPTDEAATDAEKAARKAAKRAAKAARKAAKEEPSGLTEERPRRTPDIDRPADIRKPVDVRVSDPDDYARYAPENDVLLNPPGGDCQIVFDGEDSFSGKYRKETAPQLFFAYTPAQLRAYITDRDYVTAYGSIIRIAGGLQILVLDLYVAAENADRAFGTIPRNAQLNIKTLAGDNVLLLNGKTVRGQWDNKKQHTHYRAQYIVDKDYENQLTSSEVDQIRMVWETGYDDIPIYELDFFKDMFRCLNKG